MLDIFTRLLDTGAAAGLFIAVILLIKLFYRGLSGRVSCFLWMLVGLRLALPFRLIKFSEKLFSSGTQAAAENPIVRSVERLTSIGTVAIGEPAASAPAASASVSTAAQTASARSFDPRTALVAVWMLGVAAILAYIIRSYIRLHSRLATATIYESGVYQSDAVSAPFIFGIIRPRIYVPYSISESDIPYALEHEKTHIQRRDHIAKAAAFVLLAVYWFDPLVWAAFISFCRDIELACDERVIARMEKSERRLYSTALLSCSSERPVDSVLGRTAARLCPVAFGEIGVKERILKIMKYNKPTSTARIISAALCLILTVGMMILPIGGCTEKPAPAPTEPETTASETTTTTAPTEPEVEERRYTEYEIAEDDKGGTVTLHYCRACETADGVMFFIDFGEKCDRIVASCTGGTIAQTYFDGSASCDFPPANTVESKSHFMCWTPQEINAFGSFTASGDAVITYTAYDGDTVLTEGTFNVIMTDGEFDGDYTVEITEPFTIDDGGFIVLELS